MLKHNSTAVSSGGSLASDTNGGNSEVDHTSVGPSPAEGDDLVDNFMSDAVDLKSEGDDVAIESDDDSSGDDQPSVRRSPPPDKDEDTDFVWDEDDPRANRLFERTDAGAEDALFTGYTFITADGNRMPKPKQNSAIKPDGRSSNQTKKPEVTGSPQAANDLLQIEHQPFSPPLH